MDLFSSLQRLNDKELGLAIDKKALEQLLNKGKSEEEVPEEEESQLIVNHSSIQDLSSLPEINEVNEGNQAGQNNIKSSLSSKKCLTQRKRREKENLCNVYNEIGLNKPNQRNTMNRMMRLSYQSIDKTFERSKLLETDLKVRPSFKKAQGSFYNLVSKNSLVTSQEFKQDLEQVQVIKNMKLGNSHFAKILGKFQRNKDLR